MQVVSAMRWSRHARSRSSSGLVGATAVGLAVVALAFTAGFGFVAGAPRDDLRRRSPVARRASTAQAQKLWTLEVGCTDHYVWNDKAVFTSILADAGEWELQVDVIHEAFDKAKKEGSADVFSAPLYVIRDYVQELQNYGVICRAVEAPDEAEPTEGEAAWKQKDWKELSPETKEALGDARASQEAEADTSPKASVVILKSDHPSLVAGGKSATARFRAYVEMGADAAGRFCPDEGTLNACFNRIAGPAGKSEVLTEFSPEQAEKAAEQLRQAGFTVEVVLAKKAE